MRALVVFLLLAVAGCAASSTPPPDVLNHASEPEPPPKPVATGDPNQPTGDAEGWQSDPKRTPHDDCESRCEHIEQRCMEKVIQNQHDHPEYLAGCQNQREPCERDCPP